MKVSKGTLFTIIIFGIGFIIPALGFLFPETFFASREQINQFLQGFGIWAPLIFIVDIYFTNINKIG